MADSVDRIHDRLEGILDPLASIADPLRRYHEAAQAEIYLLHAAEWLTDLRAASTLTLHQGGASYADIAEQIGLSRARAQQLVARGRELERRTEDLLRRRERLLRESWDLRHRAIEAVEEGRRIRARNRRRR